MSDIRVGTGVDVHPLASGVPMNLACLVWPDESKGCEGHSDGDGALEVRSFGLLSTADAADDSGTV